MAIYVYRHPVEDVFEEDIDGSFESFDRLLGNYLDRRAAPSPSFRAPRQSFFQPYSVQPRRSLGSEVRRLRRRFSTEQKQNIIDKVFDEFFDLSKEIGEEEARETRSKSHSSDISFLSDRSKGPFEVQVNLKDCDPEQVEVEIKDSILKVEGRRESPDGSFTYVRHEQTIPKDVPLSSLIATLLPEGTLKVWQEDEKEEKSRVLHIRKEGKKDKAETTKEKETPKTKEKDKLAKSDK